MLRTGTICASLLYSYLTTNIPSSDDAVSDHEKRLQKIRYLSDAFSNCGGLLSKISQIINLDNGNYDNKVFSECKPYNSEKTIQFILNELSNNENFKDIHDFDSNIFKSGSVGQVHKAKLNNQDVIIKVKYIGLQEQFDTDITIIDTIVLYIYGKDYIEPLKYVKIKIIEELDYTNEIKNYKLFKENWNDHNNIKIVNAHEDLCTDSVITMDYINGEILYNFIKTASVEEMDFISMRLVEFIFTSLFKHNLFYNDIHYGNFIVEDKNILHVIDFGSINIIDNELLHNIKLLYNSLYNDDEEMFYILFEELGILTDNIETEEEIDFMYQYMKLMLEPILTKGTFKFTPEWYKKSLEYNTYHDKWVLPANLIYFNKIQMGLFSLLTQMNAKGNYSDLITNLIE